MTTTATIPANSLGSLALHKGDTLRVVAVKDSELVVELTREEASDVAARNDAVLEWLRTAKGSVRLAPGETEDDVRMAYYREKYKLDQ